VAPVNQDVAGDELVRVQEQHGEQRALLDAAERERALVLGHFQGAKEPEVHTRQGAESRRP
jgi:hypothetical protein